MKFEKLTKLNREKMFSELEFFWKKIYKILFFFLLALAIFFGGYVWNRNLYSSTWSAERRKEFMEAQDRGILFNEVDYKKALDIIERRRTENSNVSGVKKDFFVAY